MNGKKKLAMLCVPAASILFAIQYAMYTLIDIGNGNDAVFQIAVRTALILSIMLSFPFAFILRELWRIHVNDHCEPFGRLHSFQSPRFRVRVCDKCKRREIYMRSWEFDGYEAEEK